MANNNFHISENQLDYIKETFNIGVGKGAKILNTMLGSHITLSVPDLILIKDKEAIFSEFDSKENLLASVDLNFSGPIEGLCKLIFPTESALKLVNGVQGNDFEPVEDGFDALSEGVLKEVGNIVLNSVIGLLCNYLKIQLNYTVPIFQESTLNDLVDGTINNEQSVALLARIQFNIETLDITGDVMTIFNMGSFSELLNLIDNQIENM